MQGVLFRPKLIRGTGFPQGVYLSDAASQYNAIDVSGMDAASSASGAGYKAAINGAGVFADGVVQNNTVIGVMNY